ncbi:MAG: lipopolysaccharide biosynthesis protein [Gammaproteobacteria bacterium]
MINNLINRYYKRIKLGLIRHNLKHLEWQLFASVIASFLGTVQYFLLYYLLGPTLFGKFTLVLSIAMVINILLDFKLVEPVIYHISNARNNKERKTFACLPLFACVLVIAFTSVCYGVTQSIGIKQVLGQPVVLIFMLSLAMLLQTYTQTLYTAIYRHEDKLKELATLRCIFQLVRVAGVGISAYFTRDLILVSMTLLFINVALLSIGWIIVKLTIDWMKSKLGNLSGILTKLYSRKTMFRNNYISTLSTIPLKELDVIILGGAISFDSLGHYKLSKLLFGALWMVIEAVNLVLFPRVIKKNRCRSEHKNTFIELLELSKKLFQIGLVLIIVVWCIWFISIQFSSLVPYDVIYWFGLMCLSLAFWSPFMWCYGYLLSVDKSTEAMKLLVSTSFLSIVAQVVLVNYFYVYGAIAATIIGGTLSSVVLLKNICKHLDIKMAKVLRIVYLSEKVSV